LATAPWLSGGVARAVLVIASEKEDVRALEHYLRDEAPPSGGHLVLRGSPNTVHKLLTDAARMASQYNLDGRPAYAISVSVATDEAELERILASSRFRIRHHYRRGTVELVSAAGFPLLPSFQQPHYTVILDPYTGERAVEFLAALPQEFANPYYVGRRR
jgi:hypothetical protein